MFAELHSILWQAVSRVAKDEGLELYDLERVTGGLRIFVSRAAIAPIPHLLTPVLASTSVEERQLDAAAQVAVDDSSGDVAGGKKQAGVDSEDCARLCRRLVTFFSVEGGDLGVGGEPTLEVSSPGINRHLRLNSHFCEAVGEQVRVQFRSGSGDIQGSDGKRTVVGTLERFTELAIFIRNSEEKNSEIEFSEEDDSLEGSSANVLADDRVIEIKFDSIVKARIEFSFAGGTKPKSPYGSSPRGRSSSGKASRGKSTSGKSTSGSDKPFRGQSAGRARDVRH